MLDQASVIGVVGPTAIGKTAVAIALAEKLQTEAEILSADSVQVYRELDIGSAKPSKEEQWQVRFHLIDVVDPDEDFTLSNYQNVAKSALEAVQKRDRIAILCGGTGLYIRALTSPLGLPHVPPDEAFRQGLVDYAELHGSDALHVQLVTKDAISAQRLHPNDTKRIIRALEVLERTGKPLSAWHADDRESGSALMPNVQLFGLDMDRNALYEIIDRRVDLMMSTGFADEVEKLRAKGYRSDLKSMNALGYRQLNAYFDGHTDLASAVAEIKLRTRQFARRQLIWFRADPRIRWIDAERKTPEAIAERVMTELV